MDQARAFAFYVVYRRHKLRRQKRLARARLHWVHPINKLRDNAGAHATLFKELRQDDKKFFNYFRMSSKTFDELHEKVKDKIQLRDTNMRNCIPSELKLAVTLRYLASGCTFTELHYTFRIGISTASMIVRSVCQAIWSLMKEELLPVPTKEKWESIALGFEQRANFPNCLGAIDGKHIRLVCPYKSGSMFFNYKEYYSVVLMAIADSEYKFVYVDIGSYGKDCDSSVFKRSRLWRALENQNLPLPTEKPLPGAQGPYLPYVFVADEAFGLQTNLMRPFGGKSLSAEKRVFNYRLSRARRYVECAFGIFSNKWRIFHRAMNVQPDFAVDLIKCCVLLHNFVRDRDGFAFEDTMTIEGLEDVQQEQEIRGNLSANNIRNTYCNYFMSPVGAVSWQMDKI